MSISQTQGKDPTLSDLSPALEIFGNLFDHLFNILEFHYPYFEENLEAHSASPKGEWDYFGNFHLINSTTIDNKYIDVDPTKFEPRDQGQDKTCYAYASATVLHLATRRIWGREGGYPRFHDILCQIVEDFKKNGAIIADVLAKYAPIYRLQSSQLADESAARTAMAKGKPVVATFSLYGKKKGMKTDSDLQWADFSDFFNTNRRGILQAADIRDCTTGVRTGHAVVLVKCEAEYLLFLNSWGRNFADGGSFRIANAKVLDMTFYDVGFLESDLLQSEIAAYKKRGLLTVEGLLKGAPHLRGLPYSCPLCYMSSPVKKFGTDGALCPHCKKRFHPTLDGFEYWG